MLYQIRRTSNWDDELPPHSRATKLRIGDYDEWVIDIDDINAFVSDDPEAEDRIVLQSATNTSKFMRIEIYDEYRE